jgi:hypothetical protein
MSDVSKTHFVQGTTPTAATLNAAYTSLVTEASNVDDDNTASSWMTLDHIDTSATQCNILEKYTNDTTSTATMSSTSYVTVSIGGAPAEINFTNFFPVQNESTRFAASGLVRGISVADDIGNNNYYAFRLLLTYEDNGGAPTTQVIGEWGYSLTARSLATTLNSGTGDQIQFQTFQFSAVRRYNGAAGVREYTKLELQGKVNFATNTFNVGRHQLFAISARN